MKKERYLITQSLLAAWSYIFDCAEGSEAEASEAFLKALKKEPSDQSEAMLRGISFENAVFATQCGNKDAAEYHASEWSKRGCEEEEAACVRAMAKRLQGGAYQLTEYKEKEISGITFLLMAKCDWVRAGVIYDCKRVETYANVGKYYESVQHPMYLEVIGSANEFRYEICDGKDIYEERYTREDIPQPIDSVIAEFVEYLKAENLLDTYKTYWKSLY